ncbi:amidohydrolase family protein [Permianibacter sp. IMCC34836]|uniref:amidohydrolase n=1 Tax=Permianibacter fluminis TaxID=2738515 RepID=UPI001554FC7D|nr:amidohydrolase [Permianibacter fluminis]NQD36374.1 amidohydrolase family protein [Permianibacter fluminis]
MSSHHSRLLRPSLLFLLSGSLIGLLFGLSACHSTPDDHADIVVRHAHVLTMDERMPTAQALAVRGGRIAAVGSDAEIGRWIGEHTRVIEGNGATVLPGLIDTHIHPVIGAEQLDDCSLGDEVMSLAAMRPTVSECLQRNPNAASTEWLAVINLNPANFHATAADLDQLLADRPFGLFGTDGHTAWINTAGLKKLGLTRASVDPDNGRIVRDGKGNPTGHLIDMAVDLVLAQLPKKSLADKVRLTERALQDMHRVGLTTLLEASAGEDILQVYRALAEQGKLSAKVSVALTSVADPSANHLQELAALRDRYRGLPHVQIDTVKVFADGVLEYPTQSGALLAPYEPVAGNGRSDRGSLYFEPEKMADFVTALDRDGFNVHVHAIGDWAVRATLDAFAAARKRNGEQSRAHFSIAHLELIDPADWPRFAALNVYASFQLLWAQPDAYSVDAVQPYLGPTRSQWLYPAAGVSKAGGVVVAGSDWNVSTFNPWEAMATGLCRCNADEPARPPLLPEQALPLPVMLRAYTIDAARMLGRDQELGSLTVGKAADLIMLNGPLATNAEQLRHTEVLTTMIDGVLVYEHQP